MPRPTEQALQRMRKAKKLFLERKKNSSNPPAVRFECQLPPEPDDQLQQLPLLEQPQLKQMKHDVQQQSPVLLVSQEQSRKNASEELGKQEEQQQTLVRLEFQEQSGLHSSVEQQQSPVLLVSQAQSRKSASEELGKQEEQQQTLVRLEFQEQSGLHSSEEQQQSSVLLVSQEQSRKNASEELGKQEEQQQTLVRLDFQEQSGLHSSEEQQQSSVLFVSQEQSRKNASEELGKQEEQQQTLVRLEFQEQSGLHSSEEQQQSSVLLVSQEQSRKNASEELGKQEEQQQTLVRLDFQEQSGLHSSEEQQQSPMRLETQEQSRSHSGPSKPPRPYLNEQQSKQDDQQLPGRKQSINRIQTRRASVRLEIQRQADFTMVNQKQQHEGQNHQQKQAKPKTQKRPQKTTAMDRTIVPQDPLTYALPSTEFQSISQMLSNDELHGPGLKLEAHHQPQPAVSANAAGGQKHQKKNRILTRRASVRLEIQRQADFSMVNQKQQHQGQNHQQKQAKPKTQKKAQKTTAMDRTIVPQDPVTYALSSTEFQSISQMISKDELHGPGLKLEPHHQPQPAVSANTARGQKYQQKQAEPKTQKRPQKATATDRTIVPQDPVTYSSPATGFQSKSQILSNDELRGRGLKLETQGDHQPQTAVSANTARSNNGKRRVRKRYRKKKFANGEHKLPSIPEEVESLSQSSLTTRVPLETKTVQVELFEADSFDDKEEASEEAESLITRVPLETKTVQEELFEADSFDDKEEASEEAESLTTRVPLETKTVQVELFEADSFDNKEEASDEAESSSQSSVTQLSVEVELTESDASEDKPVHVDVENPDLLTPMVEINGRDGYTIVCSLPLNAVEAYVKNFEFGFRYKTENLPSKGRMRYFNCSRIKIRANPQCSRKLMVFIPNSNDDATVNIKGQHTCATAPASNIARSRLTAENLTLVQTMLKAGVPSKDVKATLKLTNPAITKNQLNYAVKTTNRKLFGNGELSLGELVLWSESKSYVPEDEREGFVIAKDIDHENNKFRIIFSSKRLLSLLSRFNVLSADCTFKVTLEGYPLLVMCVIDAMRHAHPVGFAILSNQEQTDYEFAFRALLDRCTSLNYNCKVTTFLSDGELALKNAARGAFGNAITLLNCYFHVTENVTKHFRKSNEIPKEKQKEIRRDITLLQSAPTKQHFRVASELFLHKYRHYEQFTAFFSKYVRNPNYALWYEAAAPGVPATNNALEAMNKSIKYNFLKRHKEPFGTFKSRIMDIVHAYGDPNREVATERKFELCYERKAFEWLKSDNKTRTVHSYERMKSFVYVPGKGKSDVTSQDISRFEHPKFDSFDHYASEFGGLHRVDTTKDSYKKWDCTCYHFFKNNVCYHIVIVAVRKQKLTLRAEADTTKMSRKRSTGRPKQSSKALIID